MGKVADYLREHLVGEVLDEPRAIKKFSTDKSIFAVQPKILVFPRTIDDVRKVARFSWQIADKGASVSVTPRGSGMNASGSAVGPGIVVVFPEHLNKLLELDTKKNYAVFQPGINFRNLQDTLKTHGRFIPPFPVDIDDITLGGAVSTNSVGYHNVKYGSMRDYVSSLNVVLANGELIETQRLSGRQLNRKKGLSTFEGEIYRGLDGIITDNWETIQQMSSRLTHDTMGFALNKVKSKDGSFDLTPLFVGAQGTLGLVTQIQAQIMPNNMERSLMVVGLQSTEELMAVLRNVIDQEPASLELIDGGALKLSDKVFPKYFKGLLEGDTPDLLLLVEFDDSRSVQSKKVKKVGKILRDITTDYQVIDEYDERDEIWKFREVINSFVWHSDGSAQSAPMTLDGIVPLEELGGTIEAVRELCDSLKIDRVIWSHAGSGSIHMRLPLNLDRVGDRQLAFKAQDKFKDIILKHHGTLGASSGDGRLYTPLLKERFSDEEMAIIESVKKVFDPKNILNQGIKTTFDKQSQIAQITSDYSPPRAV